MLRKFTKFAYSSNNFKFLHDKSKQIIRSVLPNGAQLVTEQTAFPFNADISIAIKCGIRDESLEEKGSLFNLKQYMMHSSGADYLKNQLQNKILLISEDILRTGCMLDMNYDSEHTYWKCSCIQEDIHQMLDLVLQLSLTTKTIDDVHREQFQLFMKEQKSLDLTKKKEIPFTERILQSVFKDQSLGQSTTEANDFLPLNQHFHKFQQELITPENIIFGYSGIWTHEQFKTLLLDKLKFTNKNKPREKKPVKFISNCFRWETDVSDTFDMAVVFEGHPWRHNDMGLFQILNSFLGSSSSWSTGGPGKGMRARTTINLMNKVAAIELANSVNNHFSDIGVFGLHVAGWKSNKVEMMDHLINELKRLLDPISDEEFDRARNLLKCQIQLNLERQAERLEETVKNMFTFGEFKLDNYSEYLDSLTKQQMQDKVKQLIYETTPAVVYQGKETNQMPDLAEVMKKLRS